ncbi:xanthine dehydrogenase accessory protein XdhC [Balneatrix alpica]|uniref:Xanthine dehydrogenase accessory protein XdhC n=1 Tax=Balneatrix alpica TaxID=75684 RepID=A0ABV5ZFC7_9GAMM|nr:xanthine dehydrogenase accessory protein XdhC [Balneatrix alpica]
MQNWISALAEMQQQGEPCVLVTILADQGSTPRDAGSKMLVSKERCIDTIGGGHLEYKVIALARQMLEEGASQLRVERFALGANLGQCCGGATLVILEPLGQVRAEIALFGAGHVGRALAPLLASLPCKVRWIDSRAEEFPEQIPAGVSQIINEDPVEEVANLPKGAYVIVMTHNHQLDLELAHAILSRDDFAYFGLIGSRTKRMKFEHRLQQRQHSAERLAKMRCPLGLPEVKGKLPAEIAVAVAAEVIATYSQQQSQTQPAGQLDKEQQRAQLKLLTSLAS